MFFLAKPVRNYGVRLPHFCHRGMTMAQILIVDDDDSLRHGLVVTLAWEGHSVTGAASGEEGLGLLEDSPMDLVITDVNLPEMDGIEMLLALLDRHPSTKLIAMSGEGLLPRDELLTDARLLGAVAVLRKPFSFADLINRVNMALAA